MMRSTLGAPLGGTTWGGQYGFDWLACRFITPPNFGGGGGRYFPSMVVVALGEPGVPVVCWAYATDPANASKAQLASSLRAATPVKIRRLECIVVSQQGIMRLKFWSMGLPREIAL